jgi:hypothetical protein
MIVIDKAANTFTMSAAAGDSTIYSGGDWSGGRMVSVPFGEFSSQPQTPFWEVMALLAASVLIVFAGDSQTQQIADGSGKTFYEPNLTSPPENWEDIRKDSTQRIANMIRVPLHSDAVSSTSTNAEPTLRQIQDLESTLATLGHIVTPSSTPEIYYLQGDGGQLQHHIVGNKSGSSQWQMRTPGLCTILTLGSEVGKTDLIQVNNVGSASGTVTLTAAADGSPKNAVLSMAAGSANNAPQFTLSNIKCAPGKPLTFGLSSDGKSIVVQNSGPATSFDLNVQFESNAIQAFKGVALNAGNTGVLSWTPSSATSPTASIQLKVLDHPEGVVLSEKSLT